MCYFAKEFKVVALRDTLAVERKMDTPDKAEHQGARPD